MNVIPFRNPEIDNVARYYRRFTTVDCVGEDPAAAALKVDPVETLNKILDYSEQPIFRNDGLGNPILRYGLTSFVGTTGFLGFMNGISAFNNTGVGLGLASILAARGISKQRKGLVTGNRKNPGLNQNGKDLRAASADLAVSLGFSIEPIMFDDGTKALALGATKNNTPESNQHKIKVAKKVAARSNAASLPIYNITSDPSESTVRLDHARHIAMSGNKHTRLTTRAKLGLEYVGGIEKPETEASRIDTALQWLAVYRQKAPYLKYFEIEYSIDEIANARLAKLDKSFYDLSPEEQQNVRMLAKLELQEAISEEALQSKSEQLLQSDPEAQSDFRVRADKYSCFISGSTAFLASAQHCTSLDLRTFQNAGEETSSDTQKYIKSLYDIYMLADDSELKGLDLTGMPGLAPASEPIYLNAESIRRSKRPNKHKPRKIRATTTRAFRFAAGSLVSLGMLSGYVADSLIERQAEQYIEDGFADLEDLGSAFLKKLPGVGDRNLGELYRNPTIDIANLNGTVNEKDNTTAYKLEIGDALDPNVASGFWAIQQNDHLFARGSHRLEIGTNFAMDNTVLLTEEDITHPSFQQGGESQRTYGEWIESVDPNRQDVITVSNNRLAPELTAYDLPERDKKISNGYFFGFIVPLKPGDRISNASVTFQFGDEEVAGKDPFVHYTTHGVAIYFRSKDFDDSKEINQNPRSDLVYQVEPGQQTTKFKASRTDVNDFKYYNQGNQALIDQAQIQVFGEVKYGIPEIVESLEQFSNTLQSRARIPKIKIKDKDFEVQIIDVVNRLYENRIGDCDVVGVSAAVLSRGRLMTVVGFKNGANSRVNKLDMNEAHVQNVDEFGAFYDFTPLKYDKVDINYDDLVLGAFGFVSVSGAYKLYRNRRNIRRFSQNFRASRKTKKSLPRQRLIEGLDYFVDLQSRIDSSGRVAYPTSRGNLGRFMTTLNPEATAAMARQPLLLGVTAIKDLINQDEIVSGQKIISRSSRRALLRAARS